MTTPQHCDGVHTYAKPAPDNHVLECVDCPTLFNPHIEDHNMRTAIVRNAFYEGDLDTAQAIEGFLLHQGPRKDDFPHGWKRPSLL